MARAMTRIYENDDEDYINMRPLLRLGIWGICTIAALAAAVIAGRSDAGSERAEAALAVLLETPMDVLSHPSSALPARPTEAEAEAQRLAEMVRTLTADRDELAARVATLERNISDLTGTVARERPANPDARSDQRSDAAPSGAAVPAFAPPPVAQLCDMRDAGGGTVGAHGPEMHQDGPALRDRRVGRFIEPLGGPFECRQR